MNVAWLLEESARRTPHRGALCYDGQLTSCAELADRVGSLAAGLRGLGLVPGDRVLLCLPNRPELVETLLATLWAGMVTVPMNWHLHPDEIRYVVEHSGARAVLVADRTEAVAQALPSGPNRPLVLHADRGLPTDHAPDDQAPADVDADQPAWLFYTSGTTGRPKGATLSHRNLLAMALNYYADVDPVPPGSVFVHAAPLTHGSGLYLIPSIGRAPVRPSPARLRVGVGLPVGESGPVPAQGQLNVPVQLGLIGVPAQHRCSDHSG
jgi:acyl-CoA synthetase (AMP-forming)/AMP-acid ligase II